MRQPEAAGYCALVTQLQVSSLVVIMTQRPTHGNARHSSLKKPISGNCARHCADKNCRSNDDSFVCSKPLRSGITPNPFELTTAPRPWPTRHAQQCDADGALGWPEAAGQTIWRTQTKKKHAHRKSFLPSEQKDKNVTYSFAQIRNKNKKPRTPIFRAKVTIRSRPTQDTVWGQPVRGWAWPGTGGLSGGPRGSRTAAPWQGGGGAVGATGQRARCIAVAFKAHKQG